MSDSKESYVPIPNYLPRQDTNSEQPGVPIPYYLPGQYINSEQSGESNVQTVEKKTPYAKILAVVFIVLAIITIIVALVLYNLKSTLVVDKVGEVKIDTTNGYSTCKNNGLVWNGYKCLDTNKITTCPLKHTGALECKGSNNVFYIHDNASSDQYQCYNGMDTATAKMFDAGSYAADADRCMFGVSGSTTSASCSDLMKALKC